MTTIEGMSHWRTHLFKLYCRLKLCIIKGVATDRCHHRPVAQRYLHGQLQPPSHFTALIIFRLALSYKKSSVAKMAPHWASESLFTKPTGDTTECLSIFTICNSILQVIITELNLILIQTVPVEVVSLCRAHSASATLVTLPESPVMQTCQAWFAIGAKVPKLC